MSADGTLGSERIGELLLELSLLNANPLPQALDGKVEALRSVP